MPDLHKALLPAFVWLATLVIVSAASFLAARTLNLFVDDGLHRFPYLETAAAKPTRDDLPVARLSTAALANLLGARSPSTEAAPAINPEPSGPVRSTLHAQLLATVIANRPEWSLCTLRNLTDDETSVFMIGDVFMGARLVAIHSLEAVVLNGGRRELIDLQGSADTPAAVPGRALGIRRLGDLQYAIQRSTLDGVLANLNQLAGEAFVSPSFSKGKSTGFKLTNLKPGGLYSEAGIQNGDVVQAINGLDINSLDKAFEAYTKLRGASRLQLSVERGGQAVNLSYAIQ